MIRVTIFTIISLFFYLFDIGNLDGVRQGTEALYVQIAKEMAAANSFLVPLYRGEPHWSKPPLQFWMGMGFIKVFGGFSLGIARSSMVFVSFLSSLYLSKILRVFLRVKSLDVLVLFLGCFGTLKFSRTFMMEVPLMFLPVISLYKYYEYLIQRNNKDLVLSILIGALAFLVKGPISMVMAVFSLGVFFIFEYVSDEKFMPRLKINSIYLIGTILLSSIWFFMCYYNYGPEFFTYFFIRENVGKFNQVSMPMSRIIEGLVMFSFPWLILFPSFFKGIFNFKKLSKFQLFSLACFIGHFLIWFFPKQRSHHYAIPSLGFFLIFAFSCLPSYLKRIDKVFAFIPNVILLIFSFTCFYFSSGTKEAYVSLFCMLLTMLSIFLIFKNLLRSYLITTSLCFLIIWSVCIPVFFIPLIPNEVIHFIKEKPQAEVVVNDRRSFFFEQFLERRVKVITVAEIDKSLKLGKFVITSRSRLFGKNINEKYVVRKWHKWIRKPKRKTVFDALKNRDLGILKEDVFLLKNLEKN